MVNPVDSGGYWWPGIPHRSILELHMVEVAGPRVGEGLDRHHRRKSNHVVVSMGTFLVIRLACFDCFRSQCVSISISENVLTVMGRPSVHTECGCRVCS